MINFRPEERGGKRNSIGLTLLDSEIHPSLLKKKNMSTIYKRNFSIK